MNKISGGNLYALFFNGCCGNVNHLDYSDPLQGRGCQMTQRIGYICLPPLFRKRSPARHTMVIELANYEVGYLPTRISFKQGGYESSAGSTYYEPGTGEKWLKRRLSI